MDQNTDPRFFLRQLRGTIGLLKVAGERVFLNKVAIDRDTAIKNGDHVATGSRSAAIIEFLPTGNRACTIEVRNLQDGRIYGSVRECGHVVTAYPGAMETLEGTASYHAEILSGNEVAFTAIQGRLKVWLQSNPSIYAEVPDYHQVIVSENRISPPENVRGQIDRITGWRENFQRIRGQSIRVPDLRNMPLREAKEVLNRLGLRIDASNADRRLLSFRRSGQELVVYRQSPQAGDQAMQNDTVTVYVKAETLPAEKITVPDLRKRSLGEAAGMLKRLGLRIDVNPSNANTENRVIRQAPAPGSGVVPGSTVQVTVDVRGGGTVDVPVREIFKLPDTMTVPTQVAQWVTVPDLRKPTPKSLAESRNILEERGLRLRYSPRNARGEYWVVRQSPAAGSRVKKGTIVNLTLNPPIQ